MSTPYDNPSDDDADSFDGFGFNAALKDIFDGPDERADDNNRFKGKDPKNKLPPEPSVSRPSSGKGREPAESSLGQNKHQGPLPASGNKMSYKRPEPKGGFYNSIFRQKPPGSSEEPPKPAPPLTRKKSAENLKKPDEDDWLELGGSVEPSPEIDRKKRYPFTNQATYNVSNKSQEGTEPNPDTDPKKQDLQSSDDAFKKMLLERVKLQQQQNPGSPSEPPAPLATFPKFESKAAPRANTHSVLPSFPVQSGTNTGTSFQGPSGTNTGTSFPGPSGTNTGTSFTLPSGTSAGASFSVPSGSNMGASFRVPTGTNVGQSFPAPSGITTNTSTAPPPLPFLAMLRNTPPQDPGPEPEPSPPAVDEAQDPGAGPSGPKKKVVVVRKQVPVGSTVDTGKSALHIPTHLIDADHLKSMCSSIKALYGSQMEIQEQAYKEQIDSLVQSHARKEDMLKEEIKMVHKDYGARLDRLKNELSETENKAAPKLLLQETTSAFTVVGEQLKTFQSQIEALLAAQRSQAPNPQAPAGLSSNEMSEMLTKFESSLTNRLNETMSQKVQNVSSKAKDESSEVVAKLGQVFAQFEALSKKRDDELRYSEAKISETEKKMEAEFTKLSKQQKKFRSTLMKGTVDTLAQSMEATNESSKKKEKLNGQVKELRRDLRRLMLDSDSKHDGVQKSQSSIEAEQKHISQSLHDLNAFLQANWLGSKGNRHHSNPHRRTEIEAEMELKDLKKERNALLNTAETLNDQKRALAEERYSFEVEKEQFLHERLLVQRLQANLQLKIAEADELQKEAEASRIQYYKGSKEVSQKLSDLDIDRALFEKKRIEFGNEGGRLGRLKAELQEERMILEKIKNQALCPDCLKLLPPVPLGYQVPRVQGDGIDRAFFPSSPNIEIHKPFDNELFKDPRELNKMVLDYYGPGILDP